MNMFKQYAQSYNCTVAEAIADRDYPATLETVTEWFREAEGRDPTKNEIEIMHPESEDSVRREAARYEY